MHPKPTTQPARQVARLPARPLQKRQQISASVILRPSHRNSILVIRLHLSECTKRRERQRSSVTQAGVGRSFGGFRTESSNAIPHSITSRASVQINPHGALNRFIMCTAFQIHLPLLLCKHQSTVYASFLHVHCMNWQTAPRQAGLNVDVIASGGSDPIDAVARHPNIQRHSIADM